MRDARLFAPQLTALADPVAARLAELGAADTVAGLAAAVLARAPGRVARLALLDTDHRAETAGCA
jgi:hypothetical protein